MPDYPGSASIACEAPDRGARPPRLLELVSRAIRARHYSRRTEDSYRRWIKRFILFNGRRHPIEMGGEEVAAFLSHLATRRNVSASTQNQALSAILFLYREVLKRDLGWLDGIVRAKRPRRLPVVLTREEVREVLGRMRGVPLLMASLLYGAGLRLLECARLRVKDVDLARGEITVRDGKGRKDRVTLIPESLKGPLAEHLARVRLRHERDLRRGRGSVALPDALGRKYPTASREWAWQWIFPATRFYVDRETGERRRHHLHQSALQRARQGGCTRRGNCQAGDLPHAEALVRDPPARERIRYQDDPGAPRPQRCEHNDDLHPRSEPGREGSAEPAGRHIDSCPARTKERPFAVYHRDILEGQCITRARTISTH